MGNLKKNERRKGNLDMITAIFNLGVNPLDDYGKRATYRPFQFLAIPAKLFLHLYPGT